MNHANDEPEFDERPSKSQRKRDMTALQELGAELVTLNADQLAQIELPERLRDAVLATQRMKSHEARRRQLQYIGKLMRGVDPEPIRTTLDAWRRTARDATAQQRAVERWRERLLDDDAALAEFAAAYAGCDLQHLRTLIASVKRDRAQNRTPKNYRELFRALREIVAPAVRSAEDE